MTTPIESDTLEGAVISGASGGLRQPALSPSATEPVPVSAHSGDGQAQLLEALEAIRLYANDTLSGRADGPADAAWYRQGIVELRNRARSAILAHTGPAS